MPEYKADLHIHSCLSPCGDLSMSPAAIVKRAASIGLSIIALTDHNTALNTPTFESCCRRAGLLPVCGVEATSLEEAHVLCLFETSAQAVAFGKEIYQGLLPLPNRPEDYGDQVYVDEEENILGELEIYLTGGGCGLSIDELQVKTESTGGLFIPAHVDKPVFSLTSQLGFIPPDAYKNIEITQVNTPRPVPALMSSDAHYLDDIGKRHTRINMDAMNFDALKAALYRGSFSPEARPILTNPPS